MQKSNNAVCWAMMMMNFLRCKKNAKRFFVTCLGLQKLIINEHTSLLELTKKIKYMNKTSLLELAKTLNIPHRNCMETKEELEEAIKDTITRCKEIIFGSDTPACMACLDEL